MAGRGRGRGGKISIDLEQLGFGAGDVLPNVVLQPPPVYPPLEHPPIPIEIGVEGEYLLALKRDLVEFLSDSPAHVQYAIVRSDIDRYSDGVNATASRTTNQLALDWRYFPLELKPNTNGAKKRKKSMPGKNKKKVAKTEDITNRLEELEEKEKLGIENERENEAEAEDDGAGKENQENKEEKEDGDIDSEAEDVEDEDMDEEMDDGTDYINNYFDNGEDYVDDEDDNLDDDPIY